MNRKWDDPTALGDHVEGEVEEEDETASQAELLSFQKWAEVWLKECHRVLVPGGIIKVFSATRTFHRVGQAVENVGFTRIGLEAWCYGSGFPKSLNISKALDKLAGAEREVVGRGKAGAGFHYGNPGVGGFGATADKVGGTPSTEWDVTAAATAQAKLFEGYGTALKPAWEPFLVAVKPEKA